MTEETARQSVDTLFAESGRNDKLQITFFGGETLLNFKVIRFQLACRGICSDEGTTATTYAVDASAVMVNENEAFSTRTPGTKVPSESSTTAAACLPE